jgi:M6 family metalloprotease-like protein
MTERHAVSHVFPRPSARTAVALLATTGLLGAGLVATAGASSAAPPSTPRAEQGGHAHDDHDLRGPQAVKQDTLKQRALQQVLAGKATPQGRNKVVKLAKGQYVELARESTDKVFVVLAEFGDAVHPDYPDLVPDTRERPAQRSAGPRHNTIPAPDRAVDNSTLWKRDYNQAHYEDMYFTRMAAYYRAQSSGRYSIDGDVTAWVRVPFNQARYGRNDCGRIVCPSTRLLIRDALAQWVDGQLEGGRTLAQVTAHLRQFDVQDRYDVDRDGEFREPDGFIDHFQIVHAGGDEASGDPVYGEDAIWSHRSYADVQDGGPGGLPGVEVGSGLVDAGQDIPANRTGVWVGDYTIQPENGGLGVFAHEFGHDLGLPDLYDTSGNTGGAENSTAFWSLMSSGANTGDGSPNGIGDSPVDMGTWEKLQLGWLDYRGRPRRHQEQPPAGTGGLAVQAGAGRHHRAARQVGAARARCALRDLRRAVLPQRRRRRPRHHHDARHRLRRGAHRAGPARRRAGLGLRLPGGLQRRRHRLGADRDEPVGRRGRQERPQHLEDRYHRQPSGVDDPDGDPARRHGRDPLPLPDRRRGRAIGLPGRQHRGRRHGGRHRRRRRGLGPRRLPHDDRQ